MRLLHLHQVGFINSIGDPQLIHYLHPVAVPASPANASAKFAERYSRCPLDVHQLLVLRTQCNMIHDTCSLVLRIVNLYHVSRDDLDVSSSRRELTFDVRFLAFSGVLDFSAVHGMCNVHLKGSERASEKHDRAKT